MTAPQAPRATLLAIETSTEACSVAVYVDGEVISRHELAPRRHTQLVLPWADELMAQAGLRKSQLDAIAVGRGPGAFTGVRLAIALVQGLALALDRPVLPVSTLAVLARPCPGDRMLAAIDARMGEVYAGTFIADGQGVAATGAEAVASPGAVVLAGDDDGWHGVGTGFAAAGGALRESLGPRLASVDAAALPRAAHLARLAAAAFARGEAVAAGQLEPAYLRDTVALTLEQQAALRASR